MGFEIPSANKNEDKYVSLRNEKTGRNLLVDKNDLLDGATLENQSPEVPPTEEKNPESTVETAENEQAAETPAEETGTEAAPEKKEMTEDEKLLEALTEKMKTYEDYFKNKAGNVEYVKSIIADHDGDARAGHDEYNREKEDMLTQSLALEKEIKSLEEKIKQSRAL